MNRHLLMTTGFLWVFLSGPANASEYHLFRPVPREMMREMSTDRPDKTESPYTVDAGHYQVEMSFVDYTYDRHNGTDEDVDALNVLPVNLKMGLLTFADLQVVVEPYIWERTKDSSTHEKKSGFGDVQTRLKVNVWGNDGGKTAFAVMPFVKFPTNTDHLGNDAVEGGVILPLAVELPGGWGMGLMTEFDFNEDADDDDRYKTDYINSITFGRQIIGELNGYVEFFSRITDGNRAHWEGTVDAGVTYAFTKDIQFDMGINVGVTRAADDINPFCGLSMRY